MIKNQTKSNEMDKLLDLMKNQAMYKSQDLVEGDIIFIGRNEILVDVGGLTTGLIRGHEVYDESGEYSHLALGDHIFATVIAPENERGLIELSLKQAGHKKAWDKLDDIKNSGAVIEVVVVDANKGGLIVRYEQVMGFLPVSQLSPQNYPRVVGGNKNKILEKLKSYVGQKFKVTIMDINDEENTLIVSEREVEKDVRRQALSVYKKGGIVEGQVTGVVDFGAFVEFDQGIEGLIHISELGWQRIDNPRDIVKEGQKVRVQIIDVSDNKVSLSLKRLESDPWETVKDKYKIGDKVKAKVIKLNEFGAFVEIEPRIQGLARVVNKNKDDVQKNNPLEIGKEYELVITNFEPLDHKLGLQIPEKEVKQVKDKNKE